MAQIQTKSGVQISYDSNKENVILENLQALVLSMQSGDYFAGFHVSPPLLLIASCINITGVGDEKLITSLLFGSSLDILGEKEVELLTFLEAVGKRTEVFLKKPHQEFHIIFPLNYKSEKIRAEQIKIGQLVFNVSSWGEVSKVFDIQSLKDAVKKFIPHQNDEIYWHEQSTPLVLHIYGRSAEDVFRRGEKAYDILISAINYLVDNSIKIQFAWNSPLAMILPAAGYGVFLPTGKLDNPYVDSNYLNIQSLFEGNLDLERLNTILDLANSENKIESRFIQALLSHNDALQTTNWDAAFLSFWRVFEILAFGDRTDYDMNSVVKRICILLKANNNTMDFLNLCAKQRNNLVHKGIFSSEDQPFVLTIKVFSKKCLFEFEKLIKDYRTETMIEHYFDLTESSTGQLIEKQRVIENILKERK